MKGTCKRRVVRLLVRKDGKTVHEEKKRRLVREGADGAYVLLRGRQSVTWVRGMATVIIDR